MLPNEPILAAMNDWLPSPVVYEINTRIWLRELGEQAGRPITLADVPQAELERLAGYGFDALWLMGVWERSPAARRVAREYPPLQPGYRRALPDYTPEDVLASPYAVHRYRVDPALGDDEGLATLRERLARLGLRLMLDFVSNHLALDHPWVAEHPERLVQGDAKDLARAPESYFAAEAGGERRVFAHGRDPHFPAWTDTVQVDFRRPGARQAMTDLLLDIAGRCDGVRCDMAMLVNRDIFLRTWGGAFDPPRAEFWPAAVTALRARRPGFLMLAEVYWDLEWELQQMGFDYTYDKRLYDRLLHADPGSVRAHLHAELDYQHRLARFIENHDEERSLAALGPARSRAAATLALTLPGLRLLHEGQLEGRRVRVPVQLARRPPESPEPGLEPYYRRLLAALRHPIFRDGRWRLLEPRPAGADDHGHHRIVAHLWSQGEEHRLVAVNLAPEPARCALHLPELANRPWRLADLLAEATDRRDGAAPAGGDLHLALPSYGYRLFEVRPA